MLDYSDLLKLKRWNTPTIYNGWEQITKLDELNEASAQIGKAAKSKFGNKGEW